MKLKEGFITYRTGESFVAVSAEETGSVLNGMIRNNESADFIFRQLMNDTTEEQIVAAMLEEYDVSEDVAARDVHSIVEKYREEGFIED